MRARKDDSIRSYNPILFDVSSNMADDELWSMYNRIQREIEEANEKINLKIRSVMILQQEL
jgi:hypothetical protein